MYVYWALPLVALVILVAIILIWINRGSLKKAASSRRKKIDEALKKEVEEKADDHGHADHGTDHDDHKKKTKKTRGGVLFSVITTAVLTYSAISFLAWRHRHPVAVAGAIAPTPSTQEPFNPQPPKKGEPTQTKEPTHPLQENAKPESGKAILALGDEKVFVRSAKQEMIDWELNADCDVCYRYEDSQWYVVKDGPDKQVHIPRDWKYLKFRASDGPCTVKYSVHS